MDLRLVPVLNVVVSSPKNSVRWTERKHIYTLPSHTCVESALCSCFWFSLCYRRLHCSTLCTFSHLVSFIHCTADSSLTFTHANLDRSPFSILDRPLYSVSCSPAGQVHQEVASQSYVRPLCEEVPRFKPPVCISPFALQMHYNAPPAYQ